MYVNAYKGFVFRLKTGNAAMSDSHAVAEALRRAAERVEDGSTSGLVRDINGNTVGKWAFYGPRRPRD